MLYKFQKKLAGHPHVINFISACCNDRGGGAKEYLVVTELCSGIYHFLMFIMSYAMMSVFLFDQGEHYLMF